jgi:YVTN family beta-propeller protein
MRKKITYLIISPVLIVILILSSFSFLGISIAAAESEEYRHSVIGTLSVGNEPTKITINPLNGFIYVAASGEDRVYVIDPSTHKLVERIATRGDAPTGLAFYPTSLRDYIYVANSGSNTVSVIYWPINEVVATIPVGNAPVDVVIPPPPYTRPYVANFISGNLSIIDTSTNTVEDTIPVCGGIQPTALAFNPYNNYIYVSCSFLGDVYVINPDNNMVVGIIAVGSGPESFAVNPFSGFVYVVNHGSSTISVISPVFAVEDTIPIVDRRSTGTSPLGIAFNPTNSYLYVTNFEKATVSVIDSATNEVVDTISVGGYPYGIAFNPHNGLMYVANSGSNTVSVISIEHPGACLADNIQHWDKIAFMITSPDLAQRVNLPANTELDIKVLNDTSKAVDIKQKVLEFLKVPNEPKDTIQILGISYDIICASLPIIQPQEEEDDDDDDSIIITKNNTTTTTSTKLNTK